MLGISPAPRLARIDAGSLRGGKVMRLTLALLFILLCAVPTQAQTGPCTESAIKQGRLPAADDVFSYMPPYGKPVVGKAAIQAANAKSFSDRTNITRTWVGDHRIVSTPSGDMAYEYGTLRMGYDEGGKHNEFEAVILSVYKANGGACQIVASTMQPLEEQPKH
jgi:ketosteroid isomerase-like protein